MRLVLLGLVLSPALFAQMPAVPVPPENPITPAKAVLGKMLFWEEQLSHDDTMACATCHMPKAGGGDLRLGRHPGVDGQWNTSDDRFASPGVLRSDAQRRYVRDPVFGFTPQVTRRASPSNLGAAAYASLLFWDGRANGTFKDPLSGQTAIQTGGALESQALGPNLDAAEMGHPGRSWAQVTAKVQAARPMALATNLPADVTTALTGAPDYPELFRRAFGDPAITPVRIAFAIATYQRTLIPDQTPWDAYQRGNQNALTLNQAYGWTRFQGAGCTACHVPPLFTDHSFRNIGLRPIAEDTGRQEVTGLAGDRGRFKVATLRNVALKTSHMHSGHLENLNWVMEHYEGHTQWHLDNIDPMFLALQLSSFDRPALLDFLTNGLTDPRVKAETAPFDRPTLRSERAPNREYGAGTAGAGGLVPLVLGQQPAFVGALGFRIGLGGGLGGAPALLVLAAAAFEPPVYVGSIPVNVDPALSVVLPLTLNGTGVGAGAATAVLPIANDPALRNALLFTQGFVADALAPGSVAASRAVEFRVQ